MDKFKIETDKGIDYITFANCDEVLGDKSKKFNEWINGQTTYLEGVYKHDLERFLRNN